MITFLPRPYPDEYFYSVLIRCHIRSANQDFIETIFDSLEYSSQKLYNIELPSNLDTLISNLLPATQQTSTSLIYNNTLYPFYKTFLTSSEAWLLSEQMRKKGGKSMAFLAKLPINGEGSKPFLQFCPICLENDELRYGEAYWHRSHQIPGCLVCIDHNILLQDSLVSTTGSLDCHPANLKNCIARSGSKLYSNELFEKLCDIAQDIEWLIFQRRSFKGLKWLRQQYKHILLKRNFAYARSREEIELHSHDLLDALMSFYTVDLWKLVKPDKLEHLEQYLAYSLLACDVAQVIDRVTHILLIKFLFDSLEVLLSI